jgi:hypothetical protein
MHQLEDHRLTKRRGQPQMRVGEAVPVLTELVVKVNLLVLAAWMSMSFVSGNAIVCKY